VLSKARKPNLHWNLERLLYYMTRIQFIWARKCPELTTVPEQEYNATYNPGQRINPDRVNLNLKIYAEPVKNFNRISLFFHAPHQLVKKVTMNNRTLPANFYSDFD
jgi:hypothetical protein